MTLQQALYRSIWISEIYNNAQVRAYPGVENSLAGGLVSQSGVLSDGDNKRCNGGTAVGMRNSCVPAIPAAIEFDALLPGIMCDPTVHYVAEMRS
jgi:hypothetical protein